MPITSEELSEREREILALVATGASNKEIAQRLSISANTVKVHLRNIFAKISASSRTEAAMYAVRAGLVQQTTVTPEIVSGEPVLIESLEKLDIPDFLGNTNSRSNPEVNITEREFAGGWFTWRRAVLLVVGLLLALASGWYAWQVNSKDRLGTLASYDAVRWQTLAPLPVARSGFATAAYQGKVCIFGGEQAAGLAAETLCYDLQADTWTSRADKPTPVRDVVAATVGGKIYIPGGQTSSGQATDVFEIYDPYQDTWMQGARLPKALSGYALAEHDGRLYLFGGWDGTRAVDSVYVYDPLADNWVADSPMPTERAYAAAAVSSGRIFVLGGEDERHTLNSVVVYLPGADDHTDNLWEQGPPLPEGRSRMAVATIADIIFLAGGQNSDEDARLALQLLPQAERWEGFELPVQHTWVDLGLVPAGTKLIMLGGVLDGLREDNVSSYQAIFTISLPVIR